MKQLPNCLTPLDPLFLDPAESILRPREVLHRFDNRLDRYYFRFPESGGEIPYRGVTSTADEILGNSPYLEAWKRNMGGMADMVARVAADYGTLLETVITDFHTSGNYVDFDQLSSWVFDYAMAHKYDFAVAQWVYQIPRNLASWAAFCEERKVKLLAVQFPVWSDKYKIATPIDVLCELDFGKDRGWAIINLKKGYIDDWREEEDKPFYPNHDLQLQFERMLLAECYPDIAAKVKWVFNWAPNNWRTEPTFSFKNWTDCTKFQPDWIGRQVTAIMERPGFFAPPRKHAVMAGTYNLGDGILKNIQHLRIREMRDKINDHERKA